MPFGPLVTLILLAYVLFLGVIVTLWVVISPRRKPKRESRIQKQETAPPIEERTRRDRSRVYTAKSNDEVRGARVVVQREPDTKSAPASTPRPKKRSNDAFEDFIRSKNDDFEF